MSMDSNVTEFPNIVTHQAKNITLETVFQSMEHWRANKKNVQEQIPQAIWDDIFILLKTIPEAAVRGALGISAAQFRRKINPSTLASTSKILSPEQMPGAVDFCKAQPSALYKPVNIPATNTLIVEFCRADGRVMKIHTTTDSFAQLMQAFFAEE